MPSLVSTLVNYFGWKKLLYTTSVIGLAVVFFVVSRLRNSSRRGLQQPNRPAANAAPAANTTAAAPVSGSRTREVVCAGNGVLFRDVDGAVQFLEGAEEALGRLCSKYAVYVVTTIQGAATQECCEAVRELLRKTLVPLGLDIRKVVFCSTIKGRESIGRQISPSVHIDCDATVVGGLQPHLGAVWLVDSSMPAGAALAQSATRWTGPSLAELVAKTNAV